MKPHHEPKTPRDADAELLAPQPTTNGGLRLPSDGATVPRRLDALAGTAKGGKGRRGWLVGGMLGVAAVVLAASLYPRIRGEGASLASTDASPSSPTLASTPRERVLVFPGKVEPVDQLWNLAFDTAGILRRIHVKEGDDVAAKTVLAELVNDELNARVAAAEHDVEERRARLLMLRNGPRKEEIDEAKADVARTDAARKYYERLLQSRQKLQDRGAIAIEEVLDVRLRYDQARTEHDGSRARLARLLAGTRKEEIAMAEAALALAQARLREATAALERTRLRAPRAGRILRLLKREGESVMGLEALPVVLMADIHQLQIRAEVDERQISLVRTGLPVTFKAWGIPDRSYEGTLSRVTELMGRRQIVSDDPREKVDTRVLEILITPRTSDRLVIQQRVDVYLPIPRGEG